jgi:hypothetical protein
MAWAPLAQRTDIPHVLAGPVLRKVTGGRRAPAAIASSLGLPA